MLSYQTGFRFLKYMAEFSCMFRIWFYTSISGHPAKGIMHRTGHSGESLGQHTHNGLSHSDLSYYSNLNSAIEFH